MKPEKLSESLRFRMALVLPLVAGGVLFTFSAISNQNFSQCFSSDCINYFFDLYKYPLSIIGLAVPFSAIVAAIHRSDEASHQIDETLKQNMFNNYIKHKEEFTDLLEKLESKCTCKFSDHINLYQKIFPRNNYSSFDFRAQQKKNDPTHIAAPSNELLTYLRTGVDEIMAELYNPEADDTSLESVISKIVEVTETLKLTTPPQPFARTEQIRVVWASDFAKASAGHLVTIVRALESFAFHELKNNQHRKKLAYYLRLRNAGKIKQRNLARTNELLDEYQIDYL